MTLNPELEALLNRIDQEMGREAYERIYNVVKLYGAGAAELEMAHQHISTIQSKLNAHQWRDGANGKYPSGYYLVQRGDPFYSVPTVMMLDGPGPHIVEGLANTKILGPLPEPPK